MLRVGRSEAETGEPVCVFADCEYCGCVLSVVRAHHKYVTLMCIYCKLLQIHAQLFIQRGESYLVFSVFSVSASIAFESLNSTTERVYTPHRNRAHTHTCMRTQMPNRVKYSHTLDDCVSSGVSMFTLHLVKSGMILAATRFGSTALKASGYM